MKKKAITDDEAYGLMEERLRGLSDQKIDLYYSRVVEDFKFVADNKDKILKRALWALGLAVAVVAFAANQLLQLDTIHHQTFGIMAILITIQTVYFSWTIYLPTPFPAIMAASLLSPDLDNTSPKDLKIIVITDGCRAIYSAGRKNEGIGYSTRQFIFFQIPMSILAALLFGLL